MLFSNSSMRLEGQKMFQILARARELEKQGKDIVHFELGDPDFPTPKNIVEKCVDSLRKGNTHYSTSAGLSSFRLAAAERTKKSRGFLPSIDQILVTQGANIQIYFTLACIANPGDEVITIDPCFVSYISIMKFLGIKPVFSSLDVNESFRINISDLSKKISKKTKAILINSPHNPTGSVIDERQMVEIYEIAKKNDLFLISDEVYARMVFKDSTSSFYSPGSIDKCLERTIIIHSLSKSYAMTGWRIGAVTAPKELIARMQLLLETISSCVAPFIQEAAIEAIISDQAEISKMIDIFQERRDIIVDLLNNVNGFSCVKPDGAFYAFADIKKTGCNDLDLAEELLEKTGVAVCPGRFFGKTGEGYLRFCFANGEDQIREGIKRIESHLA